MKKTEKIAEIKRIINEWGETSTGELELSSSPIHKSMGKDNFALVERFNNDNVEVVVYVHETEVNDYLVEYEELDEELIDEILAVIEDYEVDMLKTEKRCKD